MTPREVIPAHVPEEVETEVSAALHKMVADERRFSETDQRIKKLEAGLIDILKVPRSEASWGIALVIARDALGDRND